MINDPHIHLHLHQLNVAEAAVRQRYHLDHLPRRPRRLRRFVATLRRRRAPEAMAPARPVAVAPNITAANPCGGTTRATSHAA